MNVEDVSALIAKFQAGRCLNTQRSYLHDLEAFSGWMKLPQAEAFKELLSASPGDRTRLVEVYKANLRDISLSTFQRRISILRNVCDFARKEGLLQSDKLFTRPISAFIAPPPRLRRPAETIAMPHDEILRIRDALTTDRTACGRRDLAIFDLMHERHVEGYELANMQKSDINLNRRTIRLVNGRARPKADFDLPPATAKSIASWLKAHPDPHTRFLFVRMDRAQDGKERPLTVNAIKDMLIRRATQAGVGPITIRCMMHTALHSAMLLHAKKGRVMTDLFAFTRRQLCRGSLRTRTAGSVRSSSML